MAVKDTRKKRSSCSSSAERTPQGSVSQAGDASSSSSTPRYLLPTITSHNRQRVSSVSSHPRSPSNFGSRSGDRGASATTASQNSRLSKSCEHDEKSSSRVKTPTPKTGRVSEKTSASGSHRHGDAVVDLTRSTCSSGFKRVGDAAGSSHRSRCRYSYCSLNDHEHRHSPPLKQFLSTRRVLMKQKSLKAQKSFKSGSSSKASKGRFGRDVDTGQIGDLVVEMFEKSDKKDDFGVEVFVKGEKKDDSGVEIFENRDKKDDFDTNLDPGCRESVECSDYEAEQETDDEAPMLKIHDVCGEAKGSTVDAGMKDGDVLDSKPIDDLCDKERAVSIGIEIKDGDVLDSKPSEVDSSFNADDIPAGILEEEREDNLSPPQTDDAESFDKDAMEPDRCVNSSEGDPSKPLVSLEDDPVKNLHVEKSSEGNSEMILSLNEFSFEGDSVDGSPVLENELHERVACNKDVANIDVQGFSDRSIENNIEFSLEGADMQDSVVCPQSVSSEDAIAQESASCPQFVQTCNSENIATNFVQFSILADSDAGGVPEMKQKQVETSEENVANCSIEGMGNYSSEIDGSHGMDEEKAIEITDGMISVPENITDEDACLEIPENSDIQDEPLKQDEGSFPSVSEGITMECENNTEEEIDESAGNLEGESDISNCDNEGVEGQSTESGGSPISSLQCVQKGVVVNDIHQSVEEGNEILQSAEEGNGVYKSAKRSLEFVNSNSDLEESCDGSIESNREVDQLFLEIASLQCVQKNEINRNPESVENQSLEIENDISALEGKSDRFRESRQEVEQPSLEIASNVDDFGGECNNITERSPKVQQPPLDIESHVDDFGDECGNITESSPEVEQTSLDIASHVDDLGKECINATESSNDIEQPEQKSESDAFARTEDDNETEEFDIIQEEIAESGSDDNDDFDYDDPDIVELLAATKEGNDEDESGSYDSALKSLETLFASFKSRKFSGMASSEQEGSQITQNGKFDCDNTGMVSGDRDSHENRISEAFDSVIDRSLIDDAKENCINIVKSILAGSLDQNHAFSSRSKMSGKVSRSNSIKKISWGKRKVHPSMDEMPENEKVSLMHQDANERRAAYEWMIDYALRELVNKLAPFRKTKVDLLIEAFEAISLSNSKKSGLDRPEKNPAKGLVQKKKL